MVRQIQKKIRIDAIVLEALQWLYSLPHPLKGGKEESFVIIVIFVQ